MPNAATADLTSLINDLEQAGRLIDNRADKLLDNYAQEVQAQAQAKVPRDTGKLSNSITVQRPSQLVRIIGPTVPYGVYVEFGTGSRGEFPGKPYEIKPKNKPYLIFQLNGKTVYAKKVTHPGIKAQPYMRPAVLAALEPFTGKLLSTGALLITKGPGSTL